MLYFYKNSKFLCWGSLVGPIVHGICIDTSERISSRLLYMLYFYFVNPFVLSLISGLDNCQFFSVIVRTC